MDYPLANFDASDAASAIAKAADIALILDDAGVILDVAVNAEELARANVERWIGRNIADMVTVESRPKIAALLDDDTAELRRWRQVNHPLEGASDLPVEYAVIHVAQSGSRILAGRELSGIATLQQRLIAAQQSMEREYARVRSAEARYRVLFQLTSEAVLIVDAATERVVEANPAAAALLDIRQPSSGSTSFVGLLARSEGATAQAMFATVRASGTSDTVVVTTTAGHKVALTVSLFSQGAKSLFLVRARGQDDQTAVPRQSSHLVDVVDRMPDGFVICDVEGRIISANEAFVKLTQTASFEQLRGEPIDRWIGRTGVDTNLLLGALRKYDAVQRFATVVRDEHGGLDAVEIAAVSVSSFDGTTLYGLAVRTSQPGIVTSGVGLERSVEQLTKLVGSVPLKDLVREATDLIERMCIEAALRLTDDNRASAAEILGVSRQSLYNKMRRYDLLAPGADLE